MITLDAFFTVLVRTRPILVASQQSLVSGRVFVVYLVIVGLTAKIPLTVNS